MKQRRDSVGDQPEESTKELKDVLEELPQPHALPTSEESTKN